MTLAASIPDYQILHFSVRDHPISGHGDSCYRLNLVFRPNDSDMTQSLQNSLKDYVSSVGYKTEKNARKYLNAKIKSKKDKKLTYNGEPLYFLKESKKTAKLAKQYVTYNMDPLHEFVEYLPKFDVYTYREYFQKNNVVDSILDNLYLAKKDPNKISWWEFLKLLTVLSYYWD